MTKTTSRWALALCAAPLLASCMLRLDSSPNDDDFWGSDEEGSDVYGAYAGRVDPGPARVREPAASAPLTTESDYAAADPVASTPTDMYRELIVLDPGVLGALSANDDDDAPFSFRARMQWLAGNGDALELTRGWLLEWQNASAVGPQGAPVTPRPLVGTLLADPWLGATRAAPIEKAYDAPSTPDAPSTSDVPAEPDAPADPYAPEPPASPALEPASWSDAPFGLLAIVNRLDLASDACAGAPGELRFVYGVLDAYGSSALDVTLILEVPYPTTRSAAEWARAWQELAALPPGSEYTRALARLGREILGDADPLRARVRSNEIAFADADSSAWEMREFQPTIQDGALALVQAPLALTPRADADPAELAAYVLDHADAIESTGMSLPESLRAGSALIETPDFSWNVLGVSERLRRAFSLQTCNGCHGGDTASLPFRHIGPGRTLNEPARLSRFLYDPDAPTDELRRRLDIVDALGSTECEPSPSSGAYGD